MMARHWHRLYVLLAAGAALLAGCGDSGVAPPELPTVSSHDLWAELFSGSPPTVLDVRDAADYDLGHLPGSECKPGGRSPAVPGASRVNGGNLVIVGNTELDARQAATILPGGDTARALEGGMQAWDCGLDINDVQLKQWMDSGRDARFIDVRTYAEWWNERIGGTESRPLDQLDAWATTIAPADEVVLICGSGVRSVQARDELASRGFTRMHNLVGGLGAWRYDTVCG